MSKQTRLSPEKKARMRQLAGRASQPAIAERFGVSTRTVIRVLGECPDCESCGAPTVPGSPLCGRCAEATDFGDYGLCRGRGSGRGVE